MSVPSLILQNVVDVIEAVAPRTKLNASAFRHDNKSWGFDGLQRSRTFAVLVSEAGTQEGFQDSLCSESERRLMLDLSVVYELRTGDVLASMAALVEDATDMIKALERADGYAPSTTRISDRRVTPRTVEYAGEGFALSRFEINIRYVE